MKKRKCRFSGESSNNVEHDSRSYLSGSGFTLHDSPSTLSDARSSLSGSLSTLHHSPSTLSGSPSTLHHSPSTLNDSPSTLNDSPSTLSDARFTLSASRSSKSASRSSIGIFRSYLSSFELTKNGSHWRINSFPERGKTNSNKKREVIWNLESIRRASLGMTTELKKSGYQINGSRF